MTDWNLMKSIKAQIYSNLNNEQLRLENKIGIYAIYIDSQLMYIGKSKNLLCRFVNHQINTLYDYGQKDYKEQKYQVLRLAHEKGLPIRCQPIEETTLENLAAREMYWIKKELPALNIQGTGKNHIDLDKCQQVLGQTITLY